MFSGKRSCLKRIRGYDARKEGGGRVETLLLSNNKNVIVENVLSYV